MIRRDLAPMVLLISLGMCGPALAGTLYKCSGGGDAPTSYSSRPVPGMACKAMGFKSEPSRGHSPVAYGGGAQAPAATSTDFAGSVSIPTAAGAPALASLGSARAATTGPSPQVVFQTSDASHALAPPTLPAGSHGRVTRGAMYKFTGRDGVVTYTNVPPPGSTGAKVLFTYIETCFACGALPGVNFGRLALNTNAYATEIANAARVYGVDEALVRAIIHAESNYNANARSYKGAQGLMQLMPATASRFGVQNAYVAADNINGGVQYLSFLSHRFNGDVRLIAAAYNAGEGAVDRYRGVPPYVETQRYVERVGMLAERYRGAK